MTTPTVTSSTNSQMHNNIMAAGSRDRPPMLATGRYPQWRSLFLRYIDTRPNGEALRKCILSGPYKPTTILVQVVDATVNSLAIPEHTTVETPMNMSPENKAHFEAEKEAIHLILTRIGDEIYLTVDACQTAQEIWEAIERLHQARMVKEVNELRPKRLARNANPLALVATAQANQDPYYQTSKSHKLYAPSTKPLIPIRSHTTTRHKGKEIAKPITPPSKTASKEDSDPGQVQRDKDMKKNLALIAKYFQKIYKPTNNNLGTSSNSRNKNVDTTPWENVGSLVVQQSGIQCFNCKEFGHFAKEYRKPKRVKDTTYHKEKMLLCKQAAWLRFRVQNDVGYNVFPNDLQHSKQSESVSNTCLVETKDINVIPDLPDMCEDDIQNDQNDVESDDEHAALANLIPSLKLDVDENKKIQKQLKKANTTLAQELKECKAILTKTKIVDNAWIKHSKDQFRAPTAQDMQILIQTFLMPLAIKTQNDSFVFVHELKQEMHADLKYVESLEKEIDELESDKAEFSNMYDVIMQECVSNDVKCSYLLSLSDLAALDELKCLYLHKVKECLSKPVTAQALPQTARQAVSNTNVLKPGMYRIDNRSTQTRAPQLPQTGRNSNPRVSTSTGVNHKTNVSRPQHKSNQSRDKVMPNNSQVKLKKTQVEVHPRIPVSNKMKSVTACKDSLNSRTLNANVVCATCNKCLVDSNHFACVTKILNDMHARTKKPNLVPISSRKAKSHANKSIATPHKKKVASKPINQKLQSYFRMLYEKTSKAWKWWIEQQSPSGYKWVPKTKMQWVPKAKKENVQQRIVQLILFIVDSGCMKHITGNLKLLCNFVKKFLGTVHFGNDQFAPIFGYEDLVQGNITINRRSFRGIDLLTGNRGSDLYTISLQDSTSSTPLCLMAKASPTQAWLWHQRLSHLNFDYINMLSKKDIVIGLPKLKYIKDQLCSSCELSKVKRSSFTSKVVPSSKGRLNLLHMDLYGPMRVASINGKKYILVIVDDYSRYTWTLFLHTNVPSQQELDLLFGPLYDEFFNACSNPQDKQPSTNIQPTSAPSTTTYVHAEENNDNQAEKGEHLPDDEFTNLFCAPAQEVDESLMQCFCVL
nr:hypothetical protein [Tanacetum cinerariifolium]